jgi:protocatechuate 3,4-dioxygenase beta subunit
VVAIGLLRELVVAMIVRVPTAAAALIGVAAAVATAAQSEPPLSKSAACELTPRNRGAEYKPHAPLRHNLRQRGITGVLLTLSGRVLDEECNNGLPQVLLDFWHANRQGQYDMKGFQLRGRQYTDADGRYVLRTIVPGPFLARTPHIHVKVRTPGGRLLETQLFFPGRLRAYGMRVWARNAHDGGFNPKCVVRLGPRRNNSYQATFDFVIANA